MAALVLGVSGLVYVVQARYGISLNRAAGRQWAAAAHYPQIGQCLVRLVGFALAGFGFLGARAARARRIRAAAYCIAGAYLLGMVGLIVNDCQYRRPLARLAEQYHGYQLVGLAAGIVGIVAALWVAGAFSVDNVAGSPARATMRHRRLAWAGAFYAVNAALRMVAHLLYEDTWRWWVHGLSDAGFSGVVYFVAQLVGDLVWLAAAGLVAAGFFAAARSDPLDGPRLARREHLLAAAATLFALSAVLVVCGNVSGHWLVAHRLTDGRLAVFWWIDWLGGLGVAPAGILAAIGFSLSRRSFGGVAASTADTAAPAPQGS